MAGLLNVGSGILELAFVLRIEEDLLTSLLGGGCTGAKEGNIDAVDPEFENATEPLDCETAVEGGRGLDGKLPSFEENVDNRFSQLGCCCVT